MTGDKYLFKVTDQDVREVLETARDKGLGWETVPKIRGVMSRDFKRAQSEKLIDKRPVQDVTQPDPVETAERAGFEPAAGF